MSRLFLVLQLAFPFFLARPILMTAQTGGYDENALRLDGRIGDVRIVRGIDGPILGKIGGFRGLDLTKLVEPSPRAVAEAKVFQRDYGPGTTILAVGIAALGASAGTSRIHDLNAVIPIGFGFASTAMIVYGGTRLQRAYNALYKALWWYNRDLLKR